MRNLKKLLALVLALMMVVSVMVTVNAASTDDYSAAIKALQNYGVLEGYDDGLIHEDASITRAQMAAIVYRVMTGDTSGAADTTSATKYGAYAYKFKDVNRSAWYIGYIGWCANNGVLKGYGDGNVKPDEQIKGYEVQAMLLRALGYDKNNEYTGSNWEYKVLSDATQTGINAGVTTDPAKATPRGAVAQLTYNAVRKTDVVAPAVYPNIGYNHLGYPLISVGATTEDTDAFGAYTQSTAIAFNWPDEPVPGSYNTVTKPLWQTWDAVTECDVAKGLGIDGEHWAITYTNGVDNVNLGNGNTSLGNPMPFEATDTVNKIGHEGRHTMVYVNPKFDSTVDESSTNPKYIFVFVDEFYATVDSIVDEVTDPAGHVLVPASANVTVYSNNYANGTTAAGSAQVATLSASLTGTGYTAGQVLGVHLLTGTNNALAGSAIATGTAAQKTVGYGPFALSTVKVTVKDITMDASNGVLTGTKSVGIVATTGARYFYNYTFGKGTSGSAPKQITGADIGKEVILTLDSQGNILNWTYATSATTGYGVTLSATAQQIAINEWVLNYTVLLPNGSQTTVTVGQASTGAAFANQNAAETYYTTNGVGANKLVYFAPGTTGPYSVFTKGNVTTGDIDSIKSGRPEGLTENYATDPVRGSNKIATAGALVNDKTVFFVANYEPDNTTPSSTNDYKFTGYSIYVGEKNIPDMAFTATDETTTPGNSGSPATFTHLDVQAFSGTPSGSPKAGDYASYVLVVNATQQSKPKTIPVMNYAYLITSDLFVDMGANTFTYPAIINGETGKSIQVKLAASNPLKNEGLYTYADWVNGVGYEEVYLMNGESTNAWENGNNGSTLTAPYKGDFDIAKDQYTYANGVLTSFNASTKAHDANTVYYTVANDCAVWLLNPVTGKTTKASLNLLGVDNYADNCEIWFQLDANGYISLIYVIEDPATAEPNTPKPTTTVSLDLNNSTVTGTGATITISTGVVVTGTGTAASGTYTAEATIEAWTSGYGWMPYGKGTIVGGTAGTDAIQSITCAPVLNAGTTYRVTITAKIGTVESDPLVVSFTAT